MTPDVACNELYVIGCAGTTRCGATTEVVGNKGANLIRMAEAGLPVPPGFVLPTSLCRAYFPGRQQLPEDTAELLRADIREVEKAAGLCFGGDRRPLLLAVRSGAPVSMPGMLDTILNVGLTERTLPALIRMTGRGCQIGDQLLEVGATLSLDGHSGHIYAGKLDVVVERPTQYLREVESWKARRCALPCRQS